MLASAVQPDVVPGWVTVNACPPTVMVPVRDELEPLAATAYETEPLPLPLPEVTVSHAELLVADQEHPEEVLTAKLPLPPEAPEEALAGARE